MKTKHLQLMCSSPNPNVTDDYLLVDVMLKTNGKRVLSLVSTDGGQVAQVILERDQVLELASYLVDRAEEML